MKRITLAWTGLLTAAGCASIAACGATGDNVFSDAADSGTSIGHGGDSGTLQSQDAALDPDAFWATDPPLLWCGPDGGAPAPTPPTGTVDCPSDKNREGCSCPTPGATAACWPGLRKNRGLGQCKDGQTTCIGTGELAGHWGPCEGAVLPDPSATFGNAACGCFTEGQWKIQNLVPWFYTVTANGTTSTYGYSTHQGSNGESIPPDATNLPNAGNNWTASKPSEDWSTDTLKVDCAGTFTLCYELKAGDFHNPKASDCSLAKVCLPATDYPTENVEQAFPPLSSWLAPAASGACSNQFHNSGGYGEMTVLGKTVRCDAIDDGNKQAFVFHRVEYCKASCSEADAGSDPECVKCGQDASGVFH